MQSPLPISSLHGDQGRRPDVDWLHCESIAERSRLQDWEIQPHQHAQLMQIFWIRRGHCQASLDTVEHAVKGPCVMLVPPLSVHGFRFQPGVQGQVITVLAEHLHKLLARENDLERRLLRAHVQPLDPAQTASVMAAVQGLEQEYASAQDWRSLGLDSALVRLLVGLGRCLQDQGERPALAGARARRHVGRYRELVEQRYREQPAVTACAAEIGITGTQLNRVCRQVLGCSSVAVLHARLLLEAQRELAYTAMSVKQIAHGLGFADAAYFTRFYLRQTGLTPSEWRSRSVRRPA